MPLQAYFRINAKNVGQFERTLIIIDEGAYCHYVEEVREDKPITELETRVLLADGTVVLEGTAACYTMPLG
jgi:Fe-S cluster assembly scaffold protein SufB